jgi:hypothetical protein
VYSVVKKSIQERTDLETTVQADMGMLEFAIQIGSTRQISTNPFWPESATT